MQKPFLEFKFKKSLGQNFVFDKNFLNAMANDAGLDKETSVLEIGPGAGTLSEVLAQKAKHVVCVEKDESLKDFLLEKFKNTQNIEFVFGDFLKIKKEFLEEKLGKNYKVVANLPYYITTPIIFKLIEENFSAQSLTIMVQKEVAQRFVAKPKTKDYGAISVKLNLIADLCITRFVSRTLFTPMPNVDSAVINIVFKEKKPKYLQKVFELVDCAFEQRRKIFKSNIASKFAIDKEKILQVFKELDLNENCRGEELEPQLFVLLANKLF